jgi:hypothetical protein
MVATTKASVRGKKRIVMAVHDDSGHALLTQ